MNTHQLGQFGEEQAAIYLINNGYEILQRNFRCFLGEIDIIMIKDEELVFVEVKTRLTVNYGKAKEAVGFAKQKKIYKVAQFYLQNFKGKLYQPRFDVIEVYLRDKKAHDIKIVHLPGAF